MEILYKIEDFTFEDKKQALQFEEIISNNKFYFKQKKEIYLGIVNDLDVTIYTHPKNSWVEMSKIRYLQLNRLKNF